MLTDNQFRRLLKLANSEDFLKNAAAKAGMHVQTARKYLRIGKSPSELRKDHEWRTRKDPFLEDWLWIKDLLTNNFGLEAKTIFDELTRRKPGVYLEGQLRTLQRRLKVWRALEGPPKEIYFPQIHRPGELCQSDFTDLSGIGITIQRERFDHLLYHFVLTYSNWESGTVCFSESFESLSYGLQNALWELGGVPKAHQSDSLSAAVNNLHDKREFTDKYKALLRFLRIDGKKTNPRSPHENGDIEQRHHRFKRALEQRLMLRGSKDFDSRLGYEDFLKGLMKELNCKRRDKFREEIRKLRELPRHRMEACTQVKARVTKFSTITAGKNIYSVNSSLIKELVTLKVCPENIQVWYAGKCLQDMPRLRGEGKTFINYRHIIDSLVRKPGAFRNYKYKSDLFPATAFRVAYDYLLSEFSEARADKEYVRILHLAAYMSEDHVQKILEHITLNSLPLSAKMVKQSLALAQQMKSSLIVLVEEPNLKEFDHLLDLVGAT